MVENGKQKSSVDLADGVSCLLQSVKRKLDGLPLHLPRLSVWLFLGQSRADAGIPPIVASPRPPVAFRSLSALFWVKDWDASSGGVAGVIVVAVSAMSSLSLWF